MLTGRPSCPAHPDGPGRPRRLRWPADPQPRSHVAEPSAARRPNPSAPRRPPLRRRCRLARSLGRHPPLLVAEFVVWLGFGGLLPVLPLYFTEQGIDLATLGLVIAAWPAARLVSEPIFGWLADRTARVPLMVIGLVATGVFGALPLVLTGPLAFVLLRAGAGLGAAIYDPAARGFLTDATPPERRGEAFGLYGAAQMGGLLLGPSIGAFGAAQFGGIGFVFVFSAITAVVAAVGIALRVREERYERHVACDPLAGRDRVPAGRAVPRGAARARTSPRTTAASTPWQRRCGCSTVA